MKIKDSYRDESFLKKISFLSSQSKPRRIIIASSAFFICAVSFFFIGVLATLKVGPFNYSDEPSPNGKVAHKYDERISELETIEIGISEKDLQKMVEQRRQALSNGILLTSSDDYVPAKIRYKGQVYRAKIRLKGDWAEHVKGKQWSFRVSIKDNDALFGMREFSMQHPARRNYMYGWLFQNIAKQEDILGLRIKLVDVQLNGQYVGLYYLEEHFDKLLVESNRYREGPIVKFSESDLWEERQRGNLSDEPSGAYFASPVDIFQPNKIYNNPQLRKQFVAAYNLLERFRNGELSAEQVFDVSKLARYYALSDLLGAYHMAYFHNLRFYYNPVTSLLEPIAFDADAGNVITALISERQFNENAFYDFDRMLFSDEEFNRHYLKELDRVSHKDYLDFHFLRLAKDLRENLNVLYKEFPYYQFTKDALEQNREFILKVLTPTRGLLAYLKSFSDSQMTLRIGNVHSLPIEVLGLSLDGAEVYRPTKTIILKRKNPRVPIDYLDVSFKPVAGFKISPDQKERLEIIYRVQATRHIQREKVYLWDHYDEFFVQEDLMRQPPNVGEFDFLVVNDQKRHIIVKPGQWTISKNLIIPKGYTFVAAAGTTLDLTSKANIISYSRIIFKGSEDRPIKIVSSDGSGSGLAVINALSRSSLDHVIFDNLSAAKGGNWELTGAVTFYHSHVDMEHCQFMRNRASDDALNIIRSDFTIQNSEFSQTAADAVDIDFSTGKIANVSFTKIANDAIDFSGSQVKANDVTIQYALDKGVSVGEASSVEIKDIKISHSAMGLISKDSSSFYVEDVQLNDCRIGFASYQKKPEYGPSTMTVGRFDYTEVSKLFAQQENSKITITGEAIKAKVEALK